jgi:hypothetical protein
MKLPESTSNLKLLKLFNRSVDSSWSNWAVELIQNVYHHESILWLAGISEPFNQFELKELSSEVFNVLNISLDNEDNIIQDYVKFTINQVLNKKLELSIALFSLRDLYQEREYPSCLSLFSDLAYCYADFYHWNYEFSYEWKDGLMKKDFEKMIAEVFESYMGGSAPEEDEK